mgnify:CR=1 FL=1
MRTKLLAALAAALFTSVVHAADGLVRVQSAHDVETTADRLVRVLERKGMTVFDRVDHAAGAERVGQALGPTRLVIFGNPKVGTPLMRCGRSVAIDLPQKALIWRDADGAVWLGYNDPAYLAARHGIDDCGGVIGKIEQALAGFARAATAE